MTYHVDDVVGDLVEALKQKGMWTRAHYPNSSHSVDAVKNCGNGCLYNIKEDPLEQHNLATKLPDVLKKMQSKMAEYNIISVHTFQS